MPLHPNALLRTARERAYDVWASPRVLHPADHLVAAVVRRRARRPGRAAVDVPRAHVLVCPPGDGNIGDQAMVEAFLGATDGPVVLLVREHGDVVVPTPDRSRVEVVALPRLVYGGGVGHVRDAARLARLLGRARSVSVVGADLMDGGYGHRAAANLALVAALARRAGLPSRVLGFSWNGRAHPGARAALGRAADRGTRLMLRDPLSADRARRDGLAGVEEVLDTVFMAADDLDPTAADALLGAARPDDPPLVVVNVSGLVGARVDQHADHVAVVDHLRARGARVVLLPHVRRPGGDDVAEVRRLAAAFAADAQVVAVDELLRPAQVRALADRSDAVLTGRMHLAVMALSRGVPAVCLSTQGKVDGLMAAFRSPGASVEPRPGMAGELTRRLDDALAADAPRRAELAGLAADAARLARRNVAGLDAA